MKKVSIVLVVSLVLVALFAGTVMAGVDDFSVVSYDDVVSGGYDVEAGERGSMIQNGDFSLWQDGKPDKWEVWADSAAGWEKAHLAQEDLAVPGSENTNYALGMFVRNVGGEGPYYVGASQKLDMILEAGNYWVTVHGTMFGDYEFFDAFNARFHSSPYNSVAWYGIGDTADASSVTQWRELQFTSWTTIPCHNEDSNCAYVARSETVEIAPDQYFHIKAGHKFGHFNYWTLFTFDDISIVAADNSDLENGHWSDGNISWDKTTVR